MEANVRNWRVLDCGSASPVFCIDGDYENLLRMVQGEDGRWRLEPFPPPAG